MNSLSPEIKEEKKLNLPVAQYLMRLPVYPENEVFIYMMSNPQKVYCKFPVDAKIRGYFRGHTKIRVKAKVDDGKFTLVKFVGGI